MRTRREFLHWMAVAPAAAQVTRLERRGPPQQIVILGAGLAGLCAAYELGNQGHQVTLLEAQLRAGGRVRTLREGFTPGVYCEAGPETIPGVHDLTRHYAGIFGLNLLPVGLPKTRSFYHVRGARIFPTADALWPFALNAEEAAIGLAGLRKRHIDRAVEQALAAGYPTQAMRALSEFDKHTPGAWLRANGASAGAAELLSLGFGMNFGSAASFLLHRLNSMGSTGSFRVEGGNDRLPAAFAKKVNIHYGAVVQSVTQSENGVRISVRTAGGGTETLTAHHAICTLPCPVMGKIFDDARISASKQRAIREQNYSRTVKVFLQTSKRFWLKDGLSGFVTTDLPVERLTPDPGVEPDERGALAAYPIAAFTSILERASEEERVANALSQARQIFPELPKHFEGGVSHCWGLDPWQRGSFALHTPGQIGFIDVLAQPEGRIHFAGEHTSIWTGWMQGAFDSARRTVREING